MRKSFTVLRIYAAGLFGVAALITSATLLAKVIVTYVQYLWGLW